MDTKQKYIELFISAFANDPLFSFVFADKDAGKSMRAQQWYFKTAVDYCSQYGNIASTNDNLGAIAWVNGKHFPPHFDESVINSDIADKIHMFEKHEETVEDYIVKNGQNYGYIWLLAVDENARGKGYAKLLINKTIQQMKQQGLNECWLTTENNNNISFYKKHGFTLVKQSTTGIGIETYFFKQTF